MKGFAIHNAPTDHGGIIPSTQLRSSQMGNAFVRAGDGHFCPKCKVWSTVQPSHNHVIFDGKPVAYVDDLLSCGARILSQQSHVVGTSGKASLSSSSPVFHPINLQQNLNNNLVGDEKQEKECFCHKDISMELFKLILPSDIFTKGLFYRSTYPKIKNLDIQKFLDLFNEAMKKFEINTCLRKAHFLSQISCEGDFFRTTEEYKNKNGSVPAHWNNYEGGHEYHGRGLIQLTHKANYKKYGKTVGVNFTLNNIHSVASEPEHVVNSAVWYWLKGSAWGNGNIYADKDDVHYVTMLVNGGFNHYCDRKRNLLSLIEKMQIKELCEKSKQNSKTIGNYSFSNSALSKSKVGSKIWANYQKSPSLKKYISCEL